MSKFLFANMANGTLFESVDSTAPSLILNSGQGELFSQPGTNEEFRAVIFNDLGTYEIVGVSGKVGDTLTSVSRGLEGTRRLSWEAGAYVAQRVTKEIYDSFVAAAIHVELSGRDAEDSHPQSAITGLVAALSTFTSDISSLDFTITAHKNDLADPHDVQAAQVEYDNTTSGLSANNDQDAIDELAAGSSGVHIDLTGRSVADSHPQFAITGLEAALIAKVDDSEVGAADGVAPLDSNSKVPAANLPATGVDNIYDTQTLMVADGANILEYEICLVTNDTDPTKNGQYTSLQDAPTLIAHFYFSDYSDFVDRLKGYGLDGLHEDFAGDLDTLILDGTYSILTTACTHAPSVLSDLGVVTVFRLQSKDGNEFLIQMFIDLTKATMLFRYNIDPTAGLPASWSDWKNSNDADNLPFDTSVNGGKLSSALVQGAIDENTDLAGVAQADIDSHRLNLSNPHSLTIAQIGAAADTEFDAKLGGLKDDGNHVTYTTDINLLINNSVFFITSLANSHSINFPSNMGTRGIIHTNKGDLLILQRVFSFSNFPVMASRTSDDAGASWTPWDSSGSAEHITYNNENSFIDAENVQTAIDEVVELTTSSKIAIAVLTSAKSSTFTGNNAGTELILESVTTFVLEVSLNHEKGWSMTIINKGGCTVNINPVTNVTVNGQTATLLDVCAQYKAVYLTAIDTNVILAVYA